LYDWRLKESFRRFSDMVACGHDCRFKQQNGNDESPTTNTTTTLLLLYLPGATTQDWKRFWGYQSGGRLLEAGIKTIAIK
jgi:hypothetical protein